MKDICITCCWEGLANGAWHLLKLLVWPAIIYAGIYGLGSVAFLANLRAKVGPVGRLEVAHDSWAYMLAHPYRYGIIKREGVDDVPSRWLKTSICAVYARLLHALVFVWPVLLAYFAVISVLGTVLFGVLLGVGYVSPDFTKDGWVSKTNLRDWESWPDDWTFLLRMPAVYYVVGTALFSAAFHFTAFLHGLAMVGFAVLCILPVLALIAAVVFGSRKIVREKDDGTTKVGLAAEFLASKKEGWCKMVEIK